MISFWVSDANWKKVILALTVLVPNVLAVGALCVWMLGLQSEWGWVGCLAGPCCALVAATAKRRVRLTACSLCAAGLSACTPSNQTLTLCSPTSL